MKSSPHIILWRRRSRFAFLRTWGQVGVAVADTLVRFGFVLAVGFLVMGGLFLLILAAGVTLAVARAGRRATAAA